MTLIITTGGAHAPYFYIDRSRLPRGVFRNYFQLKAPSPTDKVIESYPDSGTLGIQKEHQLVRIKLRIAQDCEETLWGLASHLEDAAFLLAFGVLIVGAFLLVT